jgi:hypothetical protein
LPRFGAEIQVEQVATTKKIEIDDVSLKILDSSLEKEDFTGAKQIEEIKQLETETGKNQ